MPSPMSRTKAIAVINYIYACTINFFYFHIYIYPLIALLFFSFFFETDCFAIGDIDLFKIPNSEKD